MKLSDGDSIGLSVVQERPNTARVIKHHETPKVKNARTRDRWSCAHSTLSLDYNGLISQREREMIQLSGSQHTEVFCALEGTAPYDSYL